MRDVIEHSDSKSRLGRELDLLKNGKMTAIGGGALTVIVMQFVAFGIIMDVISSAALVGIGYVAGRIAGRRK